MAAAIEDAGVDVVLLNFDAGDMPAGDRGLVSDPDAAGGVPGERAGRARAGAQPWAARSSTRWPATSCRDWSARPSSSSPRDNVRFAAEPAAEQGAEVLIEAVNTYENGPVPAVDARARRRRSAQSVGRDNVRLQYDAYHMQRMEGDLTATIERHFGEIAHVQIADSPGRGRAGHRRDQLRLRLGRLEELGYDGHVGLEYKAPDGDTEASLAWLPRELRGGRLPET